MQIPIESREENEDWLWRQQSAKETLRLITYSQKTCSQCLTCKHLSLSRRQALLHFQASHPEEDSRRIKFPRRNLHQETTCAKCNNFHAYNLIKLSCSNDICEACLLDLIKYCNEIETPDRVWEFQFLIRWPFCHYFHRIVKQQPSSMTYVNSHYQSQMISGSRRLQRTLSVRVSYTQYPPLCSVSREPFHMYIYCYCLIIGMPTNLLVFRENGYQSPGDYTYTGTYFKVQILYIYLFM